MISIEQMTFDAAYTGLALQGWLQSADEYGNCRYRLHRMEQPTPLHHAGQPMLKCAAGHLIPDDKYDPGFEGDGVGERRIALIVIKGGYSIKTAHELQRIHDGRVDATEDQQGTHFTKQSPDELQAAFVAYANAQGLTIPMVLDLENGVIST